MLRNTILLFILCFAIQDILKAQELEEYTRGFEYNDGIYLSLEEFKNNSPSIPLPSIVEVGRNQLGNTICMRKLEYVRNDSILEIKAKEVWGICMNGNPYIRYSEGSLLPGEPCFFKLMSIGSISTFYMQKVENKEAWNIQPYSGMRQLRPSKVKVLQFALDLESGKTFNQKSEANKIIDVIRQDAFFKDRKMKRKEVGIYITQYNNRNPLYVPVD